MHAFCLPGHSSAVVLSFVALGAAWCWCSSYQFVENLSLCCPCSVVVWNSMYLNAFDCVAFERCSWLSDDLLTAGVGSTAVEQLEGYGAYSWMLRASASSDYRL